MFAGQQKPEVVRDWLQVAQVFSVPSVTVESGISEGFGLVFAEAQAMGVPVVSFRTGGIPEAVEDGTTGFLGNERDWEFLAHHIKLLLEDSELRKGFSIAAVSRAKEHFDLARQTAALEDFYRQVGNLQTCTHRPQELGMVR
jgi:colanic acid/amylovoran biosynthesis glycosyltransferase